MHFATGVTLHIMSKARIIKVYESGLIMVKVNQILMCDNNGSNSIVFHSKVHPNF